MKYLDYFIGIFYDMIEEFFDMFNIVSGRNTMRVFYFTLLYLFLAVLCKIIGVYTFVDIKSAVAACIIALLMNCVSINQRKEIEKFKKLLKGDDGDE